MQLCNINDYNLLYNTLYDLEGADVSQNSKRLLENPDPSSPIVINNFLGFIGSLSTPVLDLDNTGDIYIEIRWASPSVCWGTANTTAPTYSATTTDCKFTNLRMTCSKINFESSDYYQLKSSQLQNDQPLFVGFYDYWTARGTSTAKSSTISMNFNVNTNSLDQCIATFQKSDYQTIKPLVLHNAASTTTTDWITYPQYFANVLGQEDTAAGVGDGFNQSYYFMRPGSDLATSQWSINSVNIDPYPLPASEIWNQNLIALGNMNLDLGASGVHPGCVSLYHFLKYYFCHILSLENLSGDGLMWRSGLSGNGSTINIGYQATFASKGTYTNVESIAPTIFCRSTKVLSIKKGHVISVV